MAVQSQSLFERSGSGRRESGGARENILLRIVALSLRAARQQLPRYGHLKSKHTFTLPQLMTCLVLKSYLKQTYRGIVELLQVSESLCEAMGLDRVPQHTTLKMFADRVATPLVLDGLIGQVLADVQADSGLCVHEIAVDSTGTECSPASRHYELRIGRKRGRYVKLMIAVACGSMLAVSAGASMGPNNDIADCWPTLWSLSGRVRPHSAYLDGGFDGERVHQLFRDGMGTASFIPPVIRSKDGGVHSEHRSKCVSLQSSYGKRWNVETFISGMKRMCESILRARQEPAMFREALLKVLAYTLRR